MSDWIAGRKAELRQQLDACPYNWLEQDDGEPITPLMAEDFFDCLAYGFAPAGDTSALSFENFARGVTRDNLSFPLFKRRATDIVDGRMDYDGAFLDRLEAMHRRVFKTKDDNRLIITSIFGPPLYDVEPPPGKKPKTIGRTNVEATMGIWWDKDYESELTPERFVEMFPGVEMYLYATSQSTPGNLRWRAFMPTDFAMPGRHDGTDAIEGAPPDAPIGNADLYWVIMRRLVEIMRENGFYTKDDFANGRAPAGAKHGGMDKGVWRPESKIYLPAVPLDPRGALSIRVPGKPIALLDWIDNHVDGVLAAEKPATAPVVDRTQLSRMDLIRLREAEKVTERPMNIAARREGLVREWRKTKSGQGHGSFFGLACGLAEHGLMTPEEVEATLREEYDKSGSNKHDRKAEIKSAIAGVHKKNLFKRF